MKTIVMAVLTVMLVVAPLAAVAAPPAPAPVGQASRVAASDARPLDLNAATLEDLVAVPGIGERLATAILELRAKRGSFASIEELLEIRGIGEKNLKTLSAFLSVAPGKAVAGEATPPVASGR